MEHPVSPATPPSLDRHSEALSQRMRNDICFVCKKQGHWMRGCPDKSPATSQTPPAIPPSVDRQNEALSQGTRNDTCFFCKKQGHWMKDCPERSPVKSQPSAASSSSFADLPVLQCPCGAGACVVVTSHTQRHPDRKFYKCPNRAPNGVGGCSFFKWCDKYSAPMCPCGAGRCRINIFENPPHKGREYFSCHIKKGHGACKFFQWVDSPAENVTSGDVLTAVVAPPEVMEIESAMGDAGESYEEDPLSVMDSGEIEEVICRFSAPERSVRLLDSESSSPEADLDIQELAMEYKDLGESTTEQMQLVSGLASPVAIRLRQQEFLRQMSASGGMLAGSTGTLLTSSETVRMVFSHLTLGWHRRLAFHPRPTLADPSPTRSFHGAFPSLTIDDMDNDGVGQSHVPQAPMESEIGNRNLQFSAGNCFLAGHVSGATREDSRFQSHPVLTSNHLSRGKASLLNQMAKLVQKEIVDLLEKNSLDYVHLEQEARDRLDCLDFLPVDSSPFKEQVKEFLLCASRLAEAECPADQTAMPEVLEHCSRAKKRFRDVSKKHSVTSDAYAASDGRLKRLREDHHCAKETLLRIEAELHGCEVEHAELQGRLAEITQEMEEAKSGMEEASREASLAVQRREIERCAARAALEKAMLQLHSNL